MRLARMKFKYYPEAESVRAYCYSEFGGPWPEMNDADREGLLADYYAIAEFSGLTPVAFSIEPSRIHLVLDVPMVQSLSDKEMLARYRGYAPQIELDHTEPLLKKNDEAAWGRLRSRFCNLATFIKRIKQVATIRYHQSRPSKGGIWRERYNRTFVQTGNASRVLTAWLDHAGLRSGRVERIEDDPFCTFGAAAAGDVRARAMITALFSEDDLERPWRQVAALYRRFITENPTTDRAVRHHPDKPLLTRAEMLMVDVPHFYYGLALGDREFVQGLFELNRTYFGPVRSVGERFVKGQNDPDLWVFRQKGDLRILSKKENEEE